MTFMPSIRVCRLLTTSVHHSEVMEVEWCVVENSPDSVSAEKCLAFHFVPSRVLKGSEPKRFIIIPDHCSTFWG